MDETTQASIARITVRYDAPQKIMSGHNVSVFYDCKQLTPNELARLAADAMGDLHIDAFDIALGIGYTGISFANAVAGGRQVAVLKSDQEIFGPDVKDKKVVIVDDVVHSGRRLTEAAKIVEKSGGKVTGYACIVDRSDGRLKLNPLWSAYQTIME